MCVCLVVRLDVIAFTKKHHSVCFNCQDLFRLFSLTNPRVTKSVLYEYKSQLNRRSYRQNTFKAYVFFSADIASPAGLQSLVSTSTDCVGGSEWQPACILSVTIETVPQTQAKTTSVTFELICVTSLLLFLG